MSRFFTRVSYAKGPRRVAFFKNVLGVLFDFDKALKPSSRITLMWRTAQTLGTFFSARI